MRETARRTRGTAVDRKRAPVAFLTVRATANSTAVAVLVFARKTQRATQLRVENRGVVRSDEVQKDGLS